MLRGDHSNGLATLFYCCTNLQIPKRLMLSLELLKKELAVATLQHNIGKQVEKSPKLWKGKWLLLLKVEEKVSKMQRNYMLHEQLKIIKKELGIEVNSNHYYYWHYTCCRKMTKMLWLRNLGRKFRYDLLQFPESTACWFKQRSLCCQQVCRKWLMRN